MKHGFSLVELSIVLVILGLLTGGILSGQSLIRASELRSVSTDTERYLTSIYTFRDKYMALPGDFKDATKFWTAQHTTAATCATMASTTQATCDGNGDGVLAYSTGSQEPFRAWQHLANAGLVEGTYAGVDDGSNHAARAAYNVPAGKFSNSAFCFRNITGGPLHFSTARGNSIYFGGTEASGNRDCDTPILKAEEAWNIDLKADDGKPGMGKMRTFNATSRPQCVTSDDPAASEYRVSSASPGCNLVILPGY